MAKELTAGLIADFSNHAVWEAVKQRIEAARLSYLNKALDESDERAAGWVRALEMVLGLPAILQKELDSPSAGKKMGRGIWR